MNDDLFTQFSFDSPEKIFTWDLIHYVMSEHQMFGTITHPNVEETRRIFTTDIGRLILFRKFVIREKLDLFLLRSFSSGVFDPTRLYFIAEKLLGPSKQQLFVGFPIYCAAVCHLCLYCARTRNFPIIILLMNILSLEMGIRRHIFLYNNGWSEFQEYVRICNQIEFIPFPENSPFYYDSFEIFFAVGLIQYVLNEHQIYYRTLRLPVVEEAEGLFTSDFGRLVMFKKTVKKRLLDIYLLLIIQSGVLNVETLLYVGEILMGRSQEFTFIGFTFYCTIVSHLCIYCATSNLFQLVSLLTNTLSYEMFQCRHIFLDNDFWDDFQEFVRIRNETDMIALGA